MSLLLLVVAAVWISDSSVSWNAVFALLDESVELFDALQFFLSIDLFLRGSTKSEFAIAFDVLPDQSIDSDKRIAVAFIEPKEIPIDSNLFFLQLVDQRGTKLSCLRL